MQTIRIATRRSRLALAQAAEVAQSLRQRQPGLRTELVELATAGDRQQHADRPPASKEDFVDALQEAMAEGSAEVAVHSMKDVPARPAGFAVQTFGPRADARDALAMRSSGGLHTLADGATVGTSSLRRRAFLQAQNRTLTIRSLRGNVDTRLRRLDAGDFDALLLACAGLDRLGIGNRISERIDPSVIVPPPGQGAIAVQYRAEREDIAAMLAEHIEPVVEEAVAAERTLAARLAADCATPFGAHCEQREDGSWRLLAAAADPEGTRCLRLERIGDDLAALVDEAATQLERLGIGGLLAEANP